MSTDGNGSPVKPPRFAYLLLTHGAPEHVEELAGRVLELSPHARVVVHHDAKAVGLPWRGQPPERIRMVERLPVSWGDWSIVEATLRMLRVAVSDLDADWFVVISGEHRPVSDLRRWEQAADASGADAFVEADPLPPRLRFGRGDEDPNRFLARCRHRWVAFDEPGVPALHRAIGGLWKISRYVQPVAALEYSHRRRCWFLGIPRFAQPKGLTFYKGTQWIGFNRRAAQAVLGADPAVTGWFQHGHIPDETYLQTLLYNDRGLDVRNQLVTYVPPGPARPVAKRWMVLGHEDLPTVWESGAAFARKVDPVERPDVIRAIDSEVDRRGRSASGALSAPGSAT